jgi:hypothetical protein
VQEYLRQVGNARVYVLCFKSNKNNFDSAVLPSPLTFYIVLANIWTFIISWNKLSYFLLTEVHCFQPYYRPRGYSLSRQVLASALERDDCSRTISPDITKVSVSFLVTKWYGIETYFLINSRTRRPIIVSVCHTLVLEPIFCAKIYPHFEYYFRFFDMRFLEEGDFDFVA